MKAATHKIITQKALQKYIQAKGERYAGVFSNALWQECIRDGTAWEDAPSKFRFTDWHFYPTNDLLKKEILGLAIPNSAYLVALRQRKLVEELEHGLSERLFTRFGRLLHHIQDMSTPTHVVPVYHGPGMPDPYEEFLDSQWEEDICPFIAGNLADTANAAQFSDLYQAAAQATLEKLAPHGLRINVLIDGVDTQADSTLFWLSHDQVEGGPKPHLYKHGFGGFGILGKHFGKTGMHRVDGHGYEITIKTYRDIAVTFVKKAINDSLAALRLFNTLLTQHTLDQ
jgi:hypothetical protein